MKRPPSQRPERQSGPMHLDIKFSIVDQLASQRPERQSGPMHLYQVGALHDPSRRSWPEQADYNYRAGGHELRIFLRGVSFGRKSKPLSRAGLNSACWSNSRRFSSSAASTVRTAGS